MSILAGSCVPASGATPHSHPPKGDLRHVEVPTDPVEREALAAIPSLGSDRIELAVAFPEGFDPRQPHPVLITQVTADRARPNVAELGAYAPTAIEQGYVVLTAQGIPWPARYEDDTLMHRYASVRAALRWLESEVPGSQGWPIVVAGFSGGAKIVQVLAFSLMLENHPVAGVFLGGCNEDHSGVLLARYPAMQDRFSQLAFYLSVGEGDRIAPPASVRDVAEHLRRAGARRLEISVHRGEHRLDTVDLGRALRWFRTQMAQSAPLASSH